MSGYEDKRSAYYENPRPEVLQFVPVEAKRVLDVGCGSGGFGAALKSRGDVEVWGVEPFPAAAAVARERIDRILESRFEPGIELPDKFFDAIVFNDSLEHFPDPMPPLALCKSKLRDAGVVICSLPNVRFVANVYHLLVDKDWRYESDGIRDYTHLRFFTRKSMLRLFEETGYRVESVTGINPIRDRRFSLLKFFLGRWVEDMEYVQYVVVARPLGENPSTTTGP